MSADQGKLSSLFMLQPYFVRRAPGFDDFFISLPDSPRQTVSVFARSQYKPNHQSVSSECDQHDARLLRSQSFKKMSNGEN